MKARIEIQGMLEKAERVIQELSVLLHRVNKDWKKLRNRVLGYILYSPAINPSENGIGGALRNTVMIREISDMNGG